MDSHNVVPYTKIFKTSLTIIYKFARHVKSCNNKHINSLTIPFLTYAAFYIIAAFYFLFWLGAHIMVVYSLSKGKNCIFNTATKLLI